MKKSKSRSVLRDEIQTAERYFYLTDRKAVKRFLMKKCEIKIKRPNRALGIAVGFFAAAAAVDFFVLSEISFIPDFYAAYKVAAAALFFAWWFVVKNLRSRSWKSFFAFAVMLLSTAFLLASFVYNLVLLTFFDDFMWRYLPHFAQMLYDLGIYF
jgi:hypothetical protein